MADSDSNVTELRPSPAKGEGTARVDRTAAERQRRRRQRKRTLGVTPAPAVTMPPVTPVTVPVTVAHPTRHAVDVAAYIAAIALAGAAAWFSIRGMVVLFPGAPLSVVAMAVAMEAAKLVTAGWLARRWRLRHRRPAPGPDGARR
jgi:hypothetical protein